MKTPSKTDEEKATNAARLLCQLLAKYGLNTAQFQMRVNGGEFDGVTFTVTIEKHEDCLCENCLNQRTEEEEE
jgi:hypothetical protein